VTLCFNIADDGSVTALAGGPISLADLGPRTTRRASHVEFNDATNEWDVTDAATRVTLFSHADYDVALAWEVQHYNERLLHGDVVIDAARALSF
jgi:hypothetical protein